MQLEIYNPVEGQALPPVEWNFGELKAWLEDGLAAYKGRVYTEDTIKDAKKDAAALRKLAAAIDGKRKEMKAKYLAPYTAFEAQAKELTGMIDAQVAEIAAQINGFEDARRAEKLAHCQAIYAQVFGDLAALVPYDKIHDKRWLNVTTSANSIEAEIVERAESVRAALSSIDALGLPDDLAARIKSVYLDRLDLAAALAEKDRIEREQQALAEYEAERREAMRCEAIRKAEAENDRECSRNNAPTEEQPAEPALYTVDFRVWATAEQLSALREWLHKNGVKYGPVG